MKKRLLGLIVLLFISGCGYWEIGKASYTGYSKICVDGVEYIQFTSGASVSCDVNGKVKQCK